METAGAAGSPARRRPRSVDGGDCDSPPTKLLRRGSDASDSGLGGLVGYADVATSPDGAPPPRPQPPVAEIPPVAQAASGTTAAVAARQSGAPAAQTAPSSSPAPTPAAEEVPPDDAAAAVAAAAALDDAPAVSRRHPRLESGLLPPEVDADAPPHIVARFTSFLRETIKGHNFTALLKAKRDFNNPYYLETVSQAFGIDDVSSRYPAHLWDPHAYGAGDFFDAIAAAQQRADAERAAAQQAAYGHRTGIPFTSAGPQAVGLEGAGVGGLGGGASQQAQVAVAAAQAAAAAAAARMPLQPPLPPQQPLRLQTGGGGAGSSSAYGGSAPSALSVGGGSSGGGPNMTAALAAARAAAAAALAPAGGTAPATAADGAKPPRRSKWDAER